MRRSALLAPEAWTFPTELGEEWRPVPGFYGYFASDLGRVLSFHRGKAHILRDGWRRNGYRMVVLTRDKKPHTLSLHRVIAEAFLGPCPEGQEVRHLDDNKAHNALVNLAYGTRSENIADSIRNGTNWNASKTHCHRGHPFDDANTYVTPGRGTRSCRICNNAKSRAYRERQMFAAARVPVLS